MSAARGRYLCVTLTDVVHCSMQEDALPSCASVTLNGRKSSSDEQIFLQRLHDYLEEKQTPIGRILKHGFEKGNAVSDIFYRHRCSTVIYVNQMLKFLPWSR